MQLHLKEFCSSFAASMAETFIVYGRLKIIYNSYLQNALSIISTGGLGIVSA